MTWIVVLIMVGFAIAINKVILNSQPDLKRIKHRELERRKKKLKDCYDEALHKEHNRKLLEFLLEKEEWGYACDLIIYNEEHFTEDDRMKLFELLFKEEEWEYANSLIKNGIIH